MGVVLALVEWFGGLSLVGSLLLGLLLILTWWCGAYEGLLLPLKWAHLSWFLMHFGVSFMAFYKISFKKIQL